MPDRLELDDLLLATGEAAEALEASRPSPMTLEESALFVKGFARTAEQPRALPTSAGQPRFTLDG